MADRAAIETMNAETCVKSPAALQPLIDQAVGACPSLLDLDPDSDPNPDPEPDLDPDPNPDPDPDIDPDCDDP